MNLKFAFALSKNNVFEKKHFGDTDKFVIYEVKSDEIILVKEIDNPFYSIDEEKEHGSKLKAESIIKYLKEEGVNVLVSMQFGKNIKRINSHFIPIIIYSQETKEVIQVINKHLHWINNELNNSKKEAYSLFTIKSGILKSKINPQRGI